MLASQPTPDGSAEYSSRYDDPNYRKNAQRKMSIMKRLARSDLIFKNASLWCLAGLPDGIFSNQKSQFG
jgi:hypothetical protein